MGNGQLVPELRFSEFEGEWTTKKLGKLGKFTGGGTPSSTKKEYWQGEIPWVSSSDISDDSIHNISISRYITKDAIINSAAKIIPAESILMVSRVGIGKFAITNFEICTSQDFTNLIPNQNYVFLAYYFKARANKFIRYSQGTSIKGFTGKDIKTLKFVIPENQKEQQKIANFLSAIDQRITLLKEKKAALEVYKKGLMQKIFSQEVRFKPDSNAPLLRGDTGVCSDAPETSMNPKNDDNPNEHPPEPPSRGGEVSNGYPDWEEKKLEEVGKIVTGKTPKSNDKSLWKDELDFVTPTDIIDGNKYQLSVARRVTRTSKLKIIPKNSILYTCIASIGKMSLSVNECVTNQQINSLIPETQFENEFVYYAIVNLTPRIKALQANTTLPIINKSEFSKIKITIPCIIEQQKIANFLSAIDQKINAMDKQITDSELFKKGLLQRMFV